MKMTALMILLVLQVVARPNATAQVTLKEKATPLEKVLKLIKKQSAYGLVFDETLLRAKGKPVSIEVADMPVEQVLAEIFRHQDQLTYTLNGKIISVKERSQGKSPAAIKAAENSEDLQLITVKGVVRDESGNPAAGVSVMIKGTTRGTSTNERGEFSLNAVPENATLVFSSINMETYETNLNGRVEVTLVMKAKISQLQEVEITAVNTGYQTIPKERATGSFVHVDNALLNRSVSTNILDRINGVTSGVLFTPGLTPGTVSSDNKAAISIRGRSTIYSNPNPLIILDNFPYDGDLSTINPNDVESIDILKDAAAASIWGAYSGNGVIVITTKKGKLNQQMKVSLNTNVTVGEKPNLWYEPRLNSSDYVSVEQYLFNSGAYNSFYTLPISALYTLQPVSAVADILNKQKVGLLTSDQVTEQLNMLKVKDYRNDLNRYFYRPSVNQQYSASLTGGGASNQYYFSAGFDNNQPSLTYNAYQRITLNANNAYNILSNRLVFSAGISYTQSNSINNNTGFSDGVPYRQLADANGNALPVTTKYRQSYIDTAGQGKLLDWNYRPLDEIRNADNNTKLSNYNINLGLKMKILSGLDASALYQYSNGLVQTQNYNSLLSFFTRDLINRYTQINYTTGAVTNNVPAVGGIVNFSTQLYYSQQFRFITNYTHNWSNDHDLTAIGGVELKKYNSQNRSYRLFGYNKDLQTFADVAYKTFFPIFLPGGGTATIPNDVSNLASANRYVSYFGNVAYTYKLKYTISASVRQDGSNIFGVSTNQKFIPLWSVGGKWSIDKEAFYHLGWLPTLKFRITNGFNANSNTSISAFITEQYVGANQWGSQYALLINPPNPSLRWEKINMTNVAIDFGFENNVVSGSIEYYHKKGTDILGNAPIAPQVGIAQLFGNVADTKGNGIDVTINLKNINTKKFGWKTNIVFSYATDVVTNYKVKPSTINSFVQSTNIAPYSVSPLEGMPLYSIFSYKWAGLDASGKPQFYLDGKASTNYSILASSSDYNNLHFNGSAVPKYFGSIRNIISLNNISVSFNIIYKLGYWFRNTFVTQSSSALSNQGIAYQDYLQRWQQPGDEMHTNVPVMTFPANTDSRDIIYPFSDIAAFKGDHVRLQDVQISYDFQKINLRKITLPSIRFYLYASNLGILWRANPQKIDPDATISGSMPNPRTVALGARFDF